MRILHVLTAFPRHPDDVIAPWLVELLHRLQRAGHEVEVFTSAYRGDGNTSFEGVPVHRFRYFPARWEDLTHDEAVPERVKRGLRYRVALLTYVVCGMWSIWRLTRSHRYDLVHVHWPLPHALFGWVARRTGRCRIVTLFYGVELRWTIRGLPFFRWFLARAARSADRVAAISRHTADQVRRLADVEVAVIPYTTPIPKPVAAGTAPMPAAPFTVLFVGRLVARKGVAILVEAFRHLPPSLDIRAVVIGEGPERDRLAAAIDQAGVATRMALRGRVSREDLARAYGAAHVLVLPATPDERGDTEGLGVVLLEAMACGVPVIASATGGITDIVVDGENGILVPPADAPALAAAIERLARDPELSQRLRQAAHAFVEQRFNWDDITHRWESLYASALGATAGARDRG